MPWWQYQALLNRLGEASAYYVHYLDGVLEIVSPSRRHESSKTRIGDLLFIYFLETDTEYFPMGSTTLRREKKQAGSEPDESYCIGSNKEVPDLAIEVIVISIYSPNVYKTQVPWLRLSDFVRVSRALPKNPTNRLRYLE